MPEIKDPRLLQEIAKQQAQQQTPQVQPQPFPGAAAPLPPSPLKTQQLQRGEQQMGLDANQDARATEALQLQRDADRRAQEKADRERKEAAITGGVDPTESEATAAFLTTRLQSNAKKINEVFQKHPEAMKPGWMETIGGLFGERAKALATPDDVNAARQILNGRFRDSVDVLLTLGTGAAYTEQQRNDYIENFSPQVTDTPELLADKRERLKEAIVAARVKSGVAVGQIDQALKEVDELYRIDDSPMEPSKEISADTKIRAIPPEMQAAHSQFLAQHPAGHLTVQDYFNFRNELDPKFLPGTSGPTIEDIRKFVDEYNKSGNASAIPGVEEQRSGIGKLIGEAAQSPTGTFVGNAANAGALGLPELLVGKEGREALDAVNAQNPIAAATGDIVGSVSPVLGMEKLGLKGLEAAAPALAKVPRAALGADVAANTLYGAARGATGAEEGDRLEAATKEGLIGGGSAAVGNLLIKGAKPFQSKETGEAIDKLEGVNLTVPQLMGGGRIEEAFRNVPGPHGARAKAVESFALNTVNRQLGHAGLKLPKDVQAGTAAVDEADKLVGAEYDKIRPLVTGTFDNTFAQGLKTLKATANTKTKKELWKELEVLQNNFLHSSGQYNGDLVKDTMSALREKASDWRLVSGTGNDSEYKAMAKVADKLRGSIKDLVKRNTPEVGAKLDGLDRAWAGLKRVERASAAAVKEDGVFSPGDYLQAIKLEGGQFSKTAAARGRGLDQDYATAASKIIGPKPSSDIGPWQTAVTGGVLTGSGGINPAIPATALTALTAFYGPGTSQIMKAMLKGKAGKGLNMIPIPDIAPVQLDDATKTLIAQMLREKYEGGQ